MTGAKRTRKSYPKAVKLETIRLMKESNRPSVEIATELGIKRNKLYKWKEQFESKGEDALTSKLGRPLKKYLGEVATLRQENERLREEVEILKKAFAILLMANAVIVSARQRLKNMPRIMVN